MDAMHMPVTRCVDCGMETSNVDPPTCTTCREAASVVARRCTCPDVHHVRGLSGLRELVDAGHDGPYSIDDLRGRRMLLVGDRAEAEALLTDWAATVS